MKAGFFSAVLFWILLLPHFVQGQGATNKNRGQLPSSFYPATGLQHDSRLLPDQQNSTTRMIENLQNPEGTLVLTGEADLQQTKEALNNFEAIVFTANYAEVPFHNGNTTYRVPAVRSSPHHSFKNTDVMIELRSYVQECFIQTNEVPASVSLAHVDRLKSCAFFSFRSKSQVARSPYYMARLNLFCVWIPLFDEKNAYAIKTGN
jgi:hypothetical protein